MTPTRSSASTPPRSAAPICTSSRATFPRSPTDASSATKPSAPSSRSAAASRTSSPATACSSRASPSCGACRFCREGRYGQCLGGGGWILGHLIDGTQAEYVRVPFADTSTYPAPAGVSDEAAPDARRHPADRLRGRRPQRHGRSPATSSPSSAAGRSVCPRSWALGCTARATSSPSTSPTPASRRPSSSAPTSSSTTAAKTRGAIVAALTGGLGADVADRSRRRACHIRARDAARPARRSRREHRRARRAGHAASRRPVDPRRHHHDRPRRHVLDAHAATPRHAATNSTPRVSSRTTSSSTRSIEAYDVFARAAETGALKVVLSRA